MNKFGAEARRLKAEGAKPWKVAPWRALRGYDRIRREIHTDKGYLAALIIAASFVPGIMLLTGARVVLRDTASLVDVLEEAGTSGFAITAPQLKALLATPPSTVAAVADIALASTPREHHEWLSQASGRDPATLHLDRTRTLVLLVEWLSHQQGGDQARTLDRLATLVSALADPDLVRAIEQLVVLPEPTRRTLISHGGKRLVDLLALTERLALERRGAKVFEAQLLAELHELGSQHASFLRLKASLEAQLVVLQGTIAALNKSQRRTQDRTATRP